MSHFSDHSIHVLVLGLPTLRPTDPTPDAYVQLDATAFRRENLSVEGCQGSAEVKVLLVIDVIWPNQRIDFKFVSLNEWIQGMEKLVNEWRNYSFTD